MFGCTALPTTGRRTSFFGAPTPAKSSTDQQRQKRRHGAYSRVMFGEGSTPSSAAVKAAISLGWPAVKAVITLLRTQGIPYIVAPYEADAQLALLAKHGHVWAAATIDSDFIIHGIERVFFRITWSSGRALFWERSTAENCSVWPNEDAYKTPFLTMLAQCGLGFLTAYSLAVGCDYGTKVAGVGPGKAITACKRLKDSKGEFVYRNLDENVGFWGQQLQSFAPGFV